MKLRHATPLAFLLACVALPPPAAAVQVLLQNATATYHQVNPTFPLLWVPANTIDGATSGAFTSWAVYRELPGYATAQPETIVWETQADLTLDGSLALKFALHHQDFVPVEGHNLGRFRLSYTTDDRSLFADGLGTGGDVDAQWTVIDTKTAQSSGGEVFTKLGDLSLAVSGGSNEYPTYTVLARFAATGITGFRLEAMEDASLPFGGPGRQPVNGNFHLSEFIVNTAVPEPSSGLLAAIGAASLALPFTHNYRVISASCSE